MKISDRVKIVDGSWHLGVTPAGLESLGLVTRQGATVIAINGEFPTPEGARGTNDTLVLTDKNQLIFTQERFLKLIETKTAVVDEWDNLTVGRKLLAIVPVAGKNHRLIEITSIDHPGMYRCKTIEDDYSNSWLAANRDGYQIINEGPFDANKLLPGQFVWVAGSGNAEWNGWKQVKGIFDEKLHVIVDADDDGCNYFNLDGTHNESFKGRVYYCPPTDPHTILANNQDFVNHVVKALTGAVTGNATCPHYGSAGCKVGSVPHPDTTCYTLYGNIGGCPCRVLGEEKVREDLNKIVKIALKMG